MNFMSQSPLRFYLKQFRFSHTHHFLYYTILYVWPQQDKKGHEFYKSMSSLILLIDLMYSTSAAIEFSHSTRLWGFSSSESLKWRSNYDKIFVEKHLKCFLDPQEKGCHPYLWWDAVSQGQGNNREDMFLQSLNRTMLE